MDLETTLQRLGLALALGLLVGLQRERAGSRIAGVRTFALITLFGAVAALGTAQFGPWLVAVGALALAATLVMANIAKLREDNDPGMTTEVAVLLMYALGAWLVSGPPEAAVAVGGAVLLLLQFKQPLHRVIGGLDEADMTAIMRFALVTCVVLPVLPDRAYGPYAVLNPRQVWWMVVLIVAIDLAGYVAAKLLAPRRGALVAGLVGGLVSSTATTIAAARRSRAAGGDAAQARLATLIIMAAAAVVFARVLVVVAIVAPERFAAVAPALAAMLAWMTLPAALAMRLGRRVESQPSQPQNPAQLRVALLFAAVYAAVLFALAVAKARFGDAGLYPVAALGGTVDVDAITLSSAGLAAQGRIEPATAWRLILVAALANLVFKAACAAALGSAALRRRVLPLFALALAGGAAILAYGG